MLDAVAVVFLILILIGAAAFAFVKITTRNPQPAKRATARQVPNFC